MAGERWLHAAFDSPSDVRDALARLATAGVAASDIEVRSSIPLDHDLHPAGLEIRSRVPYMAMLGGVLGGAAAYMLISFTSQAYPLPTGGMPIVPVPTSAVIMFEGLAIGAMLCTVATVLYECRLPQLGAGPGPLDQHLAAGSIILIVRSPGTTPQEWASRAMVTLRKRSTPRHPENRRHNETQH